MSTRASLIYSETVGLHIYHELLDDNVHVEIERDGFTSVDVVLCTYDQWIEGGNPTSLLISKKTGESHAEIQSERTS